MVAEKQCLTFISYSRADKEFALAVARELRTSGFHIWLDQLDIPTGSRWDDEVEKALVSCDIFMIILTSHSVASPNVRDEINYALGKNKRIMPILLESVEIPFRLQRVQYVDFTAKSRQEGIEDARKQLQGILEELNPLRTLPPVKPLISTVLNSQPNGPQHVRPTVKPVANQPQPQPPANGMMKMVPFLAGLSLLSIVCLIALWFVAPSLPGLLSPTTGKLATEDPGSYTIINPTTAVVSSLVPILPTSSPIPTTTIDPTQTATFTSSPTHTPIVVQDPAEFLIEYFNVVIFQKDLATGFSWLTTDYQIQKAKGWNTYTNFWGTVKSWDYSRIEVEYNNPPRARVLITYTLYYYDSSTHPSLLDGVRYCLLQTSSGESWRIDVKENCP